MARLERRDFRALKAIKAGRGRKVSPERLRRLAHRRLIRIRHNNSYDSDAGVDAVHLETKIYMTLLGPATLWIWALLPEELKPDNWV
jgi:hypothetical protein